MRKLILLAALVLTACQSAPTQPADAGRPISADDVNTTKPAGDGGRDGSPVVALVEGQSVRLGVLEPMLIEAAGGQVLGEWVLTQAVMRRLQKRGITLSDADLQREKTLLQDQIDSDANQSVRLLDQLRARRGLGPVRFAMLLKRNAGLRKLVADEVQVTEARVDQAYAQRYGPRTLVRMILTGTLKGASDALRRAKAGESFIDLAIELSEDSSRQAGGLLPPITAGDATWPKALRQTAMQLEPGQLSDPVSLDDGWAVLRCERKIPAQNVDRAAVADELRRDVRLGLERTRMQRLASVLLQEADVTVLDSELDKAFQRQRAELVQPGP